jgi:hypothetical protein
MMRILRSFMKRKDVNIPPLPVVNVPAFDRNHLESLTAYDKELRMRALDLDIDILGHRDPREQP